MPRLIAALPFFSEPAKRLYLPYRLARLPMTQARFSRRLLLEPELDLTRYKVRGEIDWAEIALSLGRDTQPIHVQSRLAPIFDGKVFVLGEGRSTIYTGRSFVCRIQNPTKAILDRGLKAIEGDWGMSKEPEVMGMEVSVDWRPLSKDAIERQLMVGLLHRHFLAPELLDRNQRTQRRLSQPRTTTSSHPDVYQTYALFNGNDLWPPFIDGTYYAGRKGDDVSWRIMDKTTDRRKKGEEPISLPPRECRARIEVTLLERPLRELGIRTLGDLEAFKFEQLRDRYFPFWLATIPMNFGADVTDSTRRFGRRVGRRQYLKRVLDAGVYAALRMDYRRALALRQFNKSLPIGRRIREEGRLKSYRLGASGYLVNFDALNKRTRDALARLRY